MNRPTQLNYDNVQALVVLHAQRLFLKTLRESLFMLLLAGILPLPVLHAAAEDFLFPRAAGSMGGPNLWVVLNLILLAGFLAAAAVLPPAALLPVCVAWAVTATAAAAGYFVPSVYRARRERRRCMAEWLGTSDACVGDAPAAEAVQGEEGDLLHLNAPVRGLYAVDYTQEEAEAVPARLHSLPAPVYCVSETEDRTLKLRSIYRLEAGLHHLPVQLPETVQGKPPTVHLLYAPYKEPQAGEQ